MSLQISSINNYSFTSNTNQFKNNRTKNFPMNYPSNTDKINFGKIEPKKVSDLASLSKNELLEMAAKGTSVFAVMLGGLSEIFGAIKQKEDVEKDMAEAIKENELRDIISIDNLDAKYHIKDMRSPMSNKDALNFYKDLDYAFKSNVGKMISFIDMINSEYNDKQENLSQRSQPNYRITYIDDAFYLGGKLDLKEKSLGKFYLNETKEDFINIAEKYKNMDFNSAKDNVQTLVGISEDIEKLKELELAEFFDINKFIDKVWYYLQTNNNWDESKIYDFYCLATIGNILNKLPSEKRENFAKIMDEISNMNLFNASTDLKNIPKEDLEVLHKKDIELEELLGYDNIRVTNDDIIKYISNKNKDINANNFRNLYLMRNDFTK